MTEKLIPASEIARIAGVSPSTVTTWRARYADFPEPAQRPKGAHHRAVFFDRSEVLAFLERYKLGSAHAWGGEVRRGRPRRDPADEPAFPRSLNRELNPAAQPGNDPVTAEMTLALDIAITLAFADRRDPDEARLVEAIGDRDRPYRDPDNPTAPPPRAPSGGTFDMPDLLRDLAARIQRREPDLRGLLFDASWAELANMRPEVTARMRLFDRVILRASRSREDAMASFEGICRGFRRSPSPWARRPLDSENALTKLLPLLTPGAPGLFVDLTCGIGSAAISALRAGFSVEGFDRNEPDIRVARQRAAVVRLLGGKADLHADFAVRDRLTTADAPTADLVVLSEPSADSERLFGADDAQGWSGIDLRVAFARSRTREGGRTLLALPTYMLDQEAGRSERWDGQADAIRTSWADSLEAVLEVPARETALPTAILIFLAEGERPRTPGILFASFPNDHRDPNEVASLLDGLRMNGAIDDRAGALTRNAAVVDRELVRAASGSLTPGYWWRREFARRPDRVDEVLDANRRLIADADWNVAAALAATGAIHASGVEPPRETAAWRSFADLMAADLLEPLRVRATEHPPLSGPREVRVPIVTPDRGDSGSPYGDDPTGGIDTRRDQELSVGDVVYWQQADRTMAVRIIEGPQRSFLVAPGRGFRVTEAGLRAGLTPELVAFAIETSSLTVERTSSRRASDSFRFPAATEDQDVVAAVRWWSDRFGETARAVAAFRSLGLRAAELSLRAEEMRRDMGMLGASQVLAFWTVRTSTERSAPSDH